MLEQKYLDLIHRFDRLGEDEERELAARSVRGDIEARNRLVEGNLRLVVSIAMQYRHLGVPLKDLVAEGNVGLVRAAELYSPDEGAKFSTYAVIWIKQKVSRLLNKMGSQVRIPEEKQLQLRKIDEIENRHRAAGNDPPDEKRLSAESGLHPDKLRDLEQAKIETSSLDAPLDSERADGGGQLGDLIEDADSEMPDERAALDDEIGELLAGLDALDDAELKIVCRRFGLDGAESDDLSSLGGDFNLSRESIRQKQEMAIVKARREIDQIDDERELQRKKSRTLTRIKRLSNVKASSFRHGDKGRRGPKRKRKR